MSAKSQARSEPGEKGEQAERAQSDETPIAAQAQQASSPRTPDAEPPSDVTPIAAQARPASRPQARDPKPPGDHEKQPASDEALIAAQAQQPNSPRTPEAEPEGDRGKQPASDEVPIAARAQPASPELAPEAELPSNLAILPSQDAVLYPGMLLPLQASDPQWIRLLSDAVSARQPIALVLQRNPTAENRSFANLYDVGTAANIVRLLRVPDGSLQVLLQGAARIRLGPQPTQTDPYLRSDVTLLAPPAAQPGGLELEGLVKNLQSLFQRVVQLSPVLPDEMAIAAANLDDTGRLADFVGANIDIEPPQRQEILQELDPVARAHRVTELVTRELEVLEIGSRIQSQIRESMEKNQREFYLRQQLQAIRRELGETDEGEASVADLRHKLAAANLSPEARAEADRELNRLTTMPTASPEHSMVRTYLEWLAELPWATFTDDDLDLHNAKRVLDEDHFDLNRVKDRILEFLAVMKLRADRDAAAATPLPPPTSMKPGASREASRGASQQASRGNQASRGASQEASREEGASHGTSHEPAFAGEGSQEASHQVTASHEASRENEASHGASREPRVAGVRGPILCLVGPPGVGKTSLGQSIARALGRKFVHMSLGGVRDEAEIRGHRRTYIGALPGRIIQALRRAGSGNPVFILDELDKVGSDWRGDPSSALLEVLDPAQNFEFRDHYLDVPFDLSKVLFIATANVLDTVPPALRDRLEVIDIPGYTEDDKVQIARRYLLRRQLVENGLSTEQVKVSDAALRRIIREYTREAGVRNLERELATVARKTARAIVMGESVSVTVTNRAIAELLGPPRFQQEVAEREDEVGVATGLAYTPTGGEVLFVEARVVPGKGSLVMTGQLGEVMKESAQAALTYARARGRQLGLGDDDPFADKDVHVHVPAGAVPKDGPSAGITLATAIISALTRRPVDHTVAMTGEITLRGRVLPIGGLKEKTLAAHRAGIRHVLVPRDNRRDIEEIPARVRKEMTFTFVDHMDQVLNAALKREIHPERTDVKPLRRRPRRSQDEVAAAAS